MKRAFVVALGVAIFPSMVVAQTELGLDAGAVITRAGGETVTAISIPSGWLRVGFPVGDELIFESLATVAYARAGGNGLTVVLLYPGLVIPIGEGTTYARVEGGLAYTSGFGGSDTQLGFGGAVGARKPIGDGTVLFRVEGGVHRWTDPGFTQIRFLLGLSAIVG